jgi:hypothetical protein
MAMSIMGVVFTAVVRAQLSQTVISLIVQPKIGAAEFFVMKHIPLSRNAILPVIQPEKEVLLPHTVTGIYYVLHL